MSTLNIGTNVQISGTGQKITGLLYAEGIVPAGSIIFIARNSVPAGYLPCNGATNLSTTNYDTLFAAIGYTFGGSGLLFGVPDLRGEFVRGWDNGRGVDDLRVFGSSQAASRVAYASDSRIPCPQSVAAGNGEDSAGITGAIQNTYAANINQSVNSYAVRPRNIALLACIKY
jgi:microcystin-dependent protein